MLLCALVASGALAHTDAVESPAFARGVEDAQQRRL
jgi:hypothetical protein